MSTSKRKRQSTAKRDAASDLQATLDLQEARRKVLVRRALAALAAGLVILAAGVVLLRGNSAAADRGAAVSAAPAQVAVIPSTPVTQAPPAEELAAPADATTSPSDPEPAAPESAQSAPEPPAPESPKSAPSSPKPVASAPKPQSLRIGIGVTGYSPSTLTASAGGPITLTVERGEGCAAGFLMPALDIAADNTAGPVTLDLGRVPAGSYQFTCGMEMIGGTLIVK